MNSVTLVACPDCEGESIRLADIGGIEHGGPCSTCSGTGLVEETEVEV